MGVEWSGPGPVSDAGSPRIPHRETPHDRAERKIDAALVEGHELERARKLTAERERLWRVAFTEVEQRAHALHELAGGNEDQQVTELKKLQSLITMALGRYDVMVAGRRGLGLYQQTTGRPLPPATDLTDAATLEWKPCDKAEAKEPHTAHRWVSTQRDGSLWPGPVWCRGIFLGGAQ